LAEEEQDRLLQDNQDVDDTNCHNNNNTNNISLEQESSVNKSEFAGGEEDNENSSFPHNSISESHQDEILMDGHESERSDAEVSERNLFEMLQTPGAWILLWISTLIVGRYYSCIDLINLEFCGLV
jgi:hypothetical protein